MPESNEVVHEAVLEVALHKRVLARIEELKRMREELVAQANQQIAAMNTAIAELEAILAPPPAEEPPQTE